MSEQYLGIDIGGTSIKYGLVDSAGAIIHKDYQPVEDGSVADLREQCLSIFRQFSKTGDSKAIAGVGIGIPGFIQRPGLALLNSPNLPKLHGINLDDELLSAFPVQATIENDANAAAWGEFSLQEIKPDSLILITLGTGVGGGIILSGELLHGTSGYAAEIGHTMLNPRGRRCGCGRRGCAEAEISMTAILSEARKGVEQGVETRLPPDPDAINGRAIIESALEGDEFCRQLLHGSAEMLGSLVGNLINIFNPEAIVLGGGMMAAEELIVPVVRRVAEERAVANAYTDCRLETSNLGNDAGLVGAALLAAR